MIPLIPAWRRPHIALQSFLMRREETRTLHNARVCLFTKEDELQWAQDRRAPGTLLLVPNVLPRAAVATADRIRRAREAQESDGSLIYIGTITYPPNFRSLLQFLDRVWPTIRADRLDAQLIAVGRCGKAEATALQRYPGVAVTGFLDDLTEPLTRASVALLPLQSWAGSSLRCLFYGLAGIPMVGTPAAFRGFARPMGPVVESPREWLEAIQGCRSGSGVVERLRRDAHQAATAIQEDERPWDRMIEAIRR